MIPTALTINALGTILGVIGAILNAIGSRAAFPFFFAGNIFLFTLFYGIYRRWWVLNSGALIQVILQAVYIGTSSYGILRCYL
jgi:hypothetical protein